jgi:hypothetical protein
MSTTVHVGAVPGSTTAHAFNPIIPVLTVLVTPVGKTIILIPAA